MQLRSKFELVKIKCSIVRAAAALHACARDLDIDAARRDVTTETESTRVHVFQTHLDKDSFFKTESVVLLQHFLIDIIVYDAAFYASCYLN